ncbi:MAG: DsbA family protein [Parvularculaceae bacterium]|nr:DsbA family protein [Parvularculaceae bacterium]
MLTLHRAAMAAFALVLAGCGEAASNSDSKAPAAAAKPAHEKESGIKASDMVIGDPNAPVTIIEYASATCPHCAVVDAEILPEIKKAYIDTGKAKLVFREFWTPPQELSMVGAIVARCAAEKGGRDAYFAVMGNLFRTQETWISQNWKTELEKLSAQAGMDKAAFDACLKRQDIFDMLQAQFKEATDKMNVTGTPAFFVNGEKTASYSKEDISKAIDAALTKSGG